MIPTELENMLSAAKEHFNSGHFQIAENLLQQLVLAAPDHVEVHHYLGCVAYKNGKIKRAIKHFRRALEIDPGFTDSTVGLSMVLNDTGRYEEARGVFEEGREQVQKEAPQTHDRFLEEQLATKHTELGDLYFQYKRYDEATDQYFEAYKYAADKTEVRMKIIDCFMKRGELARAIKELRLMIQEKPHLAKARVKLGMIYYKTNRVIEAVEQWEGVLMRDPDHPEASKLLKMAQSRQTTALT